MSNLGQIQRLPLHTQAAEVLRKRIIRGELKPTMKLNEVVICEDLGISRTPLREAIKILELEGLVTIQPHKGAIVSEISLIDIEEIFDVLAPIEALGMKLAIERMTDAERQEIIEIHDNMIACYKAHDREGCFQNDFMFHTRMIEFSRHTVIQTTYSSLTNRSQRGRYLAPRFSQTRLDTAMIEHEVLIKQVKEKNGAVASDIMFDHVISTGQFVIETLTQSKVAL